MFYHELTLIKMIRTISPQQPKPQYGRFSFFKTKFQLRQDQLGWQAIIYWLENNTTRITGHAHFHKPKLRTRLLKIKRREERVQKYNLSNSDNLNPKGETAMTEIMKGHETHICKPEILKVVQTRPEEDQTSSQSNTRK